MAAPEGSRKLPTAMPRPRRLSRGSPTEVQKSVNVSQFYNFAETGRG